MTDDQIIHIAAINGWNVSTRMGNGIRCFNFKRKTLGGVAFCFTTEMKNGKMENLISEIMSFVDAINPEVCAWEWMIKSGATSPARYLQAVADMEDIRTKAWLLACDLSKATGKSPFTHHWLN